MWFRLSLQRPVGHSLVSKEMQWMAIVLQAVLAHSVDGLLQALQHTRGVSTNLWVRGCGVLSCVLLSCRWCRGLVQGRPTVSSWYVVRMPGL